MGFLSNNELAERHPQNAWTPAQGIQGDSEAGSASLADLYSRTPFALGRSYETGCGMAHRAGSHSASGVQSPRLSGNWTRRY
jgi:hypothetical protein